jgi:hypothetical protein
VSAGRDRFADNENTNLRGVSILPSAIAELKRVVDELQLASDELSTGGVMLDEIQALRRQIDRLESAWMSRVARAHHSAAAGEAGYVTTAAFLRHVCHFSTGAARGRVDVALQIDERPAVATAFSHGDISYPHVKAITDGLEPLPPELQADAEPVLIEAAKSHDPGRVAQIARRLRHIVDPDGQAGVDERHHEQRWFDVAVTFEGSGSIRGSLDAEATAIVRTAIEALSKPAGDIDPRTGAQRRADALVEMARRSLDSGELPESGGERPHLTVAVDLTTLRRENAVPAELAFGGFVRTNGLIGVESARRIACDAVVTRVIAQPGEPSPALLGRTTGAAPLSSSLLGPPPDALPRWLLNALPAPLRGPSQPLDVGRSSRTATVPIRKALVLRDKGCVMPGCSASPSRCEAHHIIHWVDGGETSVQNMTLLCVFHHHFIHRQDWRVTLHPDGTVTVLPPLAACA